MHPVRRQISPHAARLRRESTDVERIVWSALRNRQLGNYKFRRQSTIGPFIADFACLEAMLIVELDGSQHSEAADASRTRFLEERGFSILRFWNTDIVENLNGVLLQIRAVANARVEQKQKTLTQPSPVKTGEG
ncbi:MAG: endonuclease domain-containing protein [Sphingomonas sp.]|uniref:endonuclease domain-containing protein n=1 Tax=Sphingomonas sp. TaxID=28214 RepID=UPI0025FD13E9|nr:DUF559 domain-containing protein [Sphingomonas sp.]MBX3566080.1 endonuclease domain-containing protein [Sphingomonas sp.]